jgi:Ca2+-binding RTX toxin-like protein
MRKTVLLLAVMTSALLMAGCGEPITCPTGPDGECRGTKGADQITGTSGADTMYAMGGDDSVQGGDGLGQRLQPLHLPPPVLDVVVETVSRANAFARGVLGLRGGALGDDLIKGGHGADSVKGGSGADKMYGGDVTTRPAADQATTFSTVERATNGSPVAKARMRSTVEKEMI